MNELLNHLYHRVLVAMTPMPDSVEVLQNKMEMHMRPAFLSNALVIVLMADPYSLAEKSINGKCLTSCTCSENNRFYLIYQA